MTRKWRWTFVVAAWLASLLAGVQAQTNAAAKLDTFLQGLQTLQAEFRQTLRDGQGKVIEESRGVLAIQRPDRFRWDYRAPHAQTIVADGKRLWQHDVELEQVTVRPLEQSLAGTPASLLSGGPDLRTSFDVSKAEQKGRATVVTLTPKRDDTDFNIVRIRFEGDQLTGMDLADKLGQTTELRFANLRRNGQLDKDLFVFVPPAGVDVIGDAGR